MNLNLCVIVHFPLCGYLLGAWSPPLGVHLAVSNGIRADFDLVTIVQWIDHLLSPRYLSCEVANCVSGSQLQRTYKWIVLVVKLLCEDIMFSLGEQITELGQVAKMDNRLLSVRQLEFCNQIPDVRQLHFERNLMAKLDQLWDKFTKRIEEMRKSCLSWHLPIRKRVFWPVRRIVQRRRQIVEEVHDGFAEVTKVCLGFHQ